MRALTTEVIRSRLKEKYGSSVTFVGEYKPRTKNTFKCHDCGKNWVANIHDVLHKGSGCSGICRGKKIGDALRSSKGMSSRKLKSSLRLKRPRQISLVLFKGPGAGVRHTFYCFTHKINFDAKYPNVLSGAGCPECTRDKWRKSCKPKFSSKSYADRVYSGSNGALKVLGKYKNCGTKILHKCLKCRTKLLISPRSALTHFGCRNCGYKTGSKYKEFDLGDRVVSVQGYEPEVLTLLRSKYNLSGPDLVVGSEGKIPGIYFQHKGKTRLYRPDILCLTSNCVIEVKSDWYFGIGKPEFFYTLRAKAKAVVAAGYQFRVFIVMPRYGTLMLPTYWYDWTRSDFMDYWEKKLDEVS